MNHVPRILIVEDDPGVSRMLARILRVYLGAVSDTVDTAEAAVRLLGETIYDAVISDYDLNGALTGKAVFDMMLAQRRTNRLVFMTDNDHIVRELHSAVLTKPSSLDEILTLMRAALGVA